MNELNVWLEKYHPTSLDGIVGQKNIVNLLRGYVRMNNMPHLMFAGSPGIGKTTAATVLARELFGDDWKSNIIMMNASDERGIDVIRGKIKDATRYAPINGNFKIIFLDEADEMCLVEGTKVLIGWNTNKKIVRIEDIPKDHYISIMSLNIETQKVEKDKGICIDTGVSDVYKILLEDGRTIECTDRHPFFVFDKDGNIIEKKLYELSENDEIVDFSDEVVRKCEICG